MKTGITIGLCLWLLASLVGCGHVQFRANYAHMGELDTSIDSKIQNEFNEERSNPLAQDTIKILENALPEGLTYNNGVIGNETGYNHQVLGKFDLGPDYSMFPKYEDGWRKGVCYWQVPLTWITLATWAIVPTYYPCFVSSYHSKDKIVEEVKRLTQIAGGNLAIIDFTGVDRDEPKTAVGATGFILVMDPRFKNQELKVHQQKLNAADGKNAI